MYFAKTNRGQALVEYALIITLMALIMITFLNYIATGINNSYVNTVKYLKLDIQTPTRGSDSKH